METIVSGSIFNDEKISVIRKKLKILEDFVLSKNTRVINLPKSILIRYIMLIDIKTLNPIFIKDGSSCIVLGEYQSSAMIAIGNNLFLINKTHLKNY